MTPNASYKALARLMLCAMTSACFAAHFAGTGCASSCTFCFFFHRLLSLRAAVQATCSNSQAVRAASWVMLLVAANALLQLNDADAVTR